MNTESLEKVSYTTEYIVGAGYLIFFCVLIFGCLGYFYINRSLFSPIPQPSYEFATSLPSSTPTPHISSTSRFKVEEAVFRDDFSNNKNRWLSSEDDTKEKIDNGKLFFQSRNEGTYAISSCEPCPYLDAPYFLEASLSTNVSTDEDYGLVFKQSSTLDDFFLFVINPESKKYSLWHHTPDQWSYRMSGESKLIHSYPTKNRVGIYVNKDSLEFYINGEFVDSYMESNTSFHTGYFGIYVNNSWFGVWVDDLAIYQIGK